MYVKNYQPSSLACEPATLAQINIHSGAEMYVQNFQQKGKAFSSLLACQLANLVQINIDFGVEMYMKNYQQKNKVSSSSLACQPGELIACTIRDNAPDFHARTGRM
jgi:hypothetical protein